MKKFSFFKVALVPLSIWVTGSCAEAQETTGSAQRAETPATVPVSPPVTWLDDKGLMTLDAVLLELGSAPSAAQREAVANALAERNRLLQQANQKFSQELKRVLGVDDNRQALQTEEARRQDRIRRLQPGRYQGMNKAKGKDTP